MYRNVFEKSWKRATTKKNKTHLENFCRDVFSLFGDFQASVVAPRPLPAEFFSSSAVTISNAGKQAGTL